VVPHVALSHRVNPEVREFERASTTVLSASVMPLVSGYIDRLEASKPPEAVFTSSIRPAAVRAGVLRELRRACVVGAGGWRGGGQPDRARTGA